jgi:ligand-binding SRPBCC domain-containing protein
VFQAFDINLFMKLKPPFSSLIINRFDGCNKGDIVNIDIKLFGCLNNWVSEIIDSNISESEAYFIDSGKILPSPIKKWIHKHTIKKSLNGCVIIDDIRYETSGKIIDFLIFPFLYLAFYLRKSAYRKYFK